MEEEEVKTPEETPEETPEPAAPEPTPESGITLESVHAMLLELQGTVQNLQTTQDQAIPVEPSAEEPPAEEPGAPVDGDLLDDEGNAPEEPVSDDELNELDSMLSGN